MMMMVKMMMMMMAEQRYNRMIEELNNCVDTTSALYKNLVIYKKRAKIDVLVIPPVHRPNLSTDPRVRSDLLPVGGLGGGHTNLKDTQSF